MWTGLDTRYALCCCVGRLSTSANRIAECWLEKKLATEDNCVRWSAPLFGRLGCKHHYYQRHAFTPCLPHSWGYCSQPTPNLTSRTLNRQPNRCKRISCSAQLGSAFLGNTLGQEAGPTVAKELWPAAVQFLPCPCRWQPGSPPCASQTPAASPTCGAAPSALLLPA